MCNLDPPSNTRPVRRPLSFYIFVHPNYLTPFIPHLSSQCSAHHCPGAAIRYPRSTPSSLSGMAAASRTRLVSHPSLIPASDAALADLDGPTIADTSTRGFRTSMHRPGLSSAPQSGPMTATHTPLTLTPKTTETDTASLPSRHSALLPSHTAVPLLLKTMTPVSTAFPSSFRPKLRRSCATTRS